jgi:hypothetical protein
MVGLARHTRHGSLGGGFAAAFLVAVEDALGREGEAAQAGMGAALVMGVDVVCEGGRVREHA